MQSPRILQTVNMLPDKDSNHEPRKKCKEEQELVPRWIKRAVWLSMELSAL